MTEHAGVVVTRWRRYGHDRLYVRAPDGTDLGWWDLTAGQVHARTPEREATVATAAAEWLAEQGGAAPAGGPDASVVSADQHLADQHPAAQPPAAPPVVETVADPGPADPGPADPGPADPGPAAAGPVDVDLALTRPGAAARARAEAARDAAPVRTFFVRLLGVRTEERAWRIGADGEEKVASKFDKLIRKDPRWRVLHAIPVGSRGSDIDHLLVGPGGVFTVNTKHHPGAKIWVADGTVMVNGRRHPYIRNSRHEAARAARLLTAACGFPVSVEGVIVAVRADAVTVKSPPDGVHVVPRIQVVRWLRRRTEVHSPAAVDAIYAAARRSTTWQP